MTTLLNENEKYSGPERLKQRYKKGKCSNNVYKKAIKDEAKVILMSLFYSTSEFTQLYLMFVQDTIQNRENKFKLDDLSSIFHRFMSEDLLGKQRTKTLISALGVKMKDDIAKTIAKLPIYAQNGIEYAKFNMVNSLMLTFFLAKK